jgi:hypothetical protein
MESKLKGRDAVIYHALQAAGAIVTLHLVIFSTDRPVPGDSGDAESDGQSDFYDLRHTSHEEAMKDPKLRNDYGPYTVIYPHGVTGEGDSTSYGKSDYAQTLTHNHRWARGRLAQDLPGLVEVTSSPPSHYLSLSWVSHGNYAQLNTEYGSICIIATVPGEIVDAPWGPLIPWRTAYWCFEE